MNSRSLQALMYAATLGIAILGAVSVSLAAQAQESHPSVPRRGDVSMPGGQADCDANPREDVAGRPAQRDAVVVL